MTRVGKMLVVVLVVAACGDDAATSEATVPSATSGAGGGMGGSGGSGGAGGAVASYPITVTVAGLEGEVVVTRGPDELALVQDGTFELPTAVEDGADFTVAIASAPALQTCEVSPSSGVVMAAPVNVVIQCSSHLMFAAAADGSNHEPWATDGSEAGTRLVRALTPGGSFPVDFINLHDGRWIFSASTTDEGTEPWITDGTEAGTMLLSDIAPGASDSSPDSYTRLGDRVYFAATSPASGRELWVTDGSSAGTRLVADIRPGAWGSGAERLVSVGDELFLLANDGEQSLFVLRADGQTLDQLATGNFGSMVAVGSRVFFSNLQTDVGTELFVSDGTAGGTQLVRDINPGTEGAAPGMLVALQDALIFVANDGVSLGLWRSDGTAQGTEKISDAASEIGTGGIGPAVSVGPRVVFVANTTTYGSELWSTDGTLAGTALVVDLEPGVGGGVGTLLDVFEGALLFSSVSSTAPGLWRSDGTPLGTSQLWSSLPDQQLLSTLGATSSRACFLVSSAATGTEPWCTDGTTANTSLLADICPGSCSGIAY